MIYTFLQSITLAQADDGSGWTNLIPMIVIAVLYGLSSIVKNKQEKKSPPPRPREGSEPPSPPTGPVRRLPGYARKIPGSPTPPPAGPVTGRPIETSGTVASRPDRPVPQQTVRPVPQRAVRPVPQRAARPVPQRVAQTPADQPTRGPVPRSLPPVTVQKKPVSRPAGQIPRRSDAARMAHEKARQTFAAAPQAAQSSGAPITSAKTGGRIATKAQKIQTRKVMQHPRSSSEAIPSVQGLQIAFQQPSDLARAVVYSEIIGPPKAFQTQNILSLQNFPV